MKEEISLGLYNTKSICNYLKSRDLDDLLFENIMKIMVDKAPGYASSHNGYLPWEVLLGAFQLGGAYICTEIIPLLDGKPVLLLRKEEDGSDETNWVGRYHIPGSSNLKGEKIIEGATYRLIEKEIGGENLRKMLSEKPLTVSKVYEIDRNTWAYTFVYTMTIDDVSVLKNKKDWLTINPENIDKVIAEHQPLINMIIHGEKIPPLLEIS